MQCHDADTIRQRVTLPKEMSLTIVFLGIDLAKNVFALHGGGKPALVRPTVRRDPLLERMESGMAGRNFRMACGNFNAFTPCGSIQDLSALWPAATTAGSRAGFPFVR